MSGKLLRTIRLDPSDSFAFERAAEPGEWAVPGSFMFFGTDVASLKGKPRIAFRSGWLGLVSFGWSTIAVVTPVTADERQQAVRLLADRLVAEHGAPDLPTALAAADEELSFAESCADHPEQTLVVLHRTLDADGDIREQFRTVKAGLSFDKDRHSRVFSFHEVEGEEEPEEQVDLLALSRKTTLMDQRTHHETGHEFWVSSGHVLLQRDAEGRLAVTDEFVKAFYARPEVMPPEEACAAERALHARLTIAPLDPVEVSEIAAILDPDAQENWRLLVDFRDRLVAAGTLEAAYLSLVRQGMGRTPPLFVNQLVHAILRNALDDEDDAFVLRAAEMFFRPQRLTINEGALLLADEETVDGAKVDPHASPLAAMFGEQAAKELDILIGDNAEGYRARSDAFDLALDFGLDKPARAALGRVIEHWLAHLMGLTVTVRPLASIEDRDWNWFIGLDQEATRIGNMLWKGKDVPEADRARVVALYEMTFSDDARLLPQMQGKPAYLILAMGADRIVRIKAQNIVANLPLKDTH